MGRPSLGTAARIHQVSVKLSAAELAYLERRYGSGGKGLRAAVECLLPASIGSLAPIGNPRVLHEAPTLLPSECTHTAWRTATPARGDTMLTQTCRNCGHTRTIRRPS